MLDDVPGNAGSAVTDNLDSKTADAQSNDNVHQDEWGLEDDSSSFLPALTEEQLEQQLKVRASDPLFQRIYLYPFFCRQEMKVTLASSAAKAETSNKPMQSATSQPVSSPVLSPSSELLSPQSLPDADVNNNGTTTAAESENDDQNGDEDENGEQYRDSLAVDDFVAFATMPRATKLLQRKRPSFLLPICYSLSCVSVAFLIAIIGYLSCSQP